MSPKGQKTTLEERITIAERTNSGENIRETATALGRPLPTVRKWRQRYHRGGRAELSSQMGRPADGALAKTSVKMREALLDMRDKHPGWGARTLRLELAKDKRFANQTIPSRARIAAYLKEKERVRKYEHHQRLPEPKEQPVQRPHQEWEVDAQGVTMVAGVGKVSPSTCWMSTAMSVLTAMSV